MKKYFFGMLAAVFAIGFSAFTTVKNTKSTATDNIFRFFVSPITEVNIEMTNTHNGIDFYANWQLVSSASCTVGEQKACRVEVDEKYVKEASKNFYVLLAENIPSEGKYAFPMAAIPGTSGSNYRVDPGIESGDIDVINAQN
jgi:hypothetical protein